MYEETASAVRCDMVLHRVFRARHVELNKHVTPHLHREYHCKLVTCWHNEVSMPVTALLRTPAAYD